MTDRFGIHIECPDGVANNTKITTADGSAVEYVRNAVIRLEAGNTAEADLEFCGLTFKYFVKSWKTRVGNIKEVNKELSQMGVVLVGLNEGLRVTTNAKQDIVYDALVGMLGVIEDVITDDGMEQFTAMRDGIMQIVLEGIADLK